MGFFDSVLEETPKTPATTPVNTDSQDGSFLIINDNVQVEKLPDTAVQIFDTPSISDSEISENTSTSEISFFSENTESPKESSEIQENTIEQAAEIIGESSAAEISFFEEPSITEITPVIEEKSEATVSESENFLSSQEVSESPEMNFMADAIDEEIKTVTVAPEKNDIYAPLKEAIEKYDTILAAHMQIAEAKDVEIVQYNEQIAEAKRIAKLAVEKAQASSKKALEERKALETEIDRVKQMKELFAAQLK